MNKSIKLTPKQASLIEVLKANPHDDVLFDDMMARHDDLWDKLYNHFGLIMPYGTAKARTGDPYMFVFDNMDKINIDNIQVEV